MKKNTLFCLLTILSVGNSIAQTSKVPKTIQTTVRPTKTIQELSIVEGIHEYQLSNGLKVLLIPDDSQSNTTINIVYHVGSRHEGYGEAGMAHLLEHMLFKSTKKLGDIKKTLSERGAIVNGETYRDKTNYYETFPASDDNLKWCLEMEADRMINATILKSDLDKEFSVVRNEFEMGENNPSKIILEHVISSAYVWHNYGKAVIGSREDIERVNVERLRSFYEKYYQPDNATLIVGGKFDIKKSLSFIQETFGTIPKPKRKLLPTYTLEPAQDGERYVEVRRNGNSKEMAVVYHTVPYAHEDYPLIDLLLNIHFNDPSGFLYKDLVDTKNVVSQYQWSPKLRDASFVHMHFIMDNTKDYFPISKLVLKELDSISNSPIIEADLQRGKSSILKSLENEQNETTSFAIELADIIGAGDFRLRMIYRDRIEKATISDLERVAKTYFKANNRTYGLFIPSTNEERVKPVEVSTEQIAALTKDYKGKLYEKENLFFEATIPNVIKSTKDFLLPNGFKYSIVRKPVKGGKVSMEIAIPVGSEESLKGKQYIATMMGYLMMAGTSDMTKAEIKDKIDVLKANVSFNFSGQKLIINIDSYKDKLADLLPIIKAILNHPIFPQDELEKDFLAIKTNLESQKQDPESITFTEIFRLSENYSPDHIFYTPTIEERIEGFSKVKQTEIIDFYTNYLNLSSGYATVMGTVNEDEIKSWLNDIFGEKKAPNPYVFIRSSIVKTTGDVKEIITPDKENAVVGGLLSINISERHPDYPAMVMLDEMLGSGGFLTARLQTRLREKEGISYTVGSQLSVSPIEDRAFILIYAFFNPKFKDKVKESLVDEIQKVLNGGITEDELKKALIIHANAQKSNLGTDSYLIELNNKKHAYQIPLQVKEELESKIQKLTIQQINQVVKKYIDPQKISWIYAGDFKKE